MTWDEYCIILLRQLLDDDTVPYTYSDERLTKMLCTAGVLVQVENKLKNQYEVNMATYTITPDPLTLDPPDELFIALIVYKTACIIAQSKPMKTGHDSIRVTDAGTTVDVKGKNSSDAAASANFCGMYDKIRQEAARNGTDGVIRYGLVVNSYGQQTVISNFR